MDRKDQLLRIGKRVKFIRETKGLSQTQLANNIGKDQPSINRLEKGNVNPSYLYILEVCEGLEITIAEFFNETLE